MNKKVSVLLLCMNHEKYIEQCLMSIFTQTFKDFEIIFLDNASSDRSFEIGKEMLEKSGFPFKAFKNEHSRLVTINLNFLLDNSSGDYLFPLSTDDWMTPENISIKLQHLQPKDVGLVFGGGWWYYEDTDQYIEVDTSKFRRDNMSINLLLEPQSYFWVGAAYSRAIVIELGKWDENLIIEDLDLNLRIARKYKIDFVPQSLVYYRRHSSTFMSNYKVMHKGFNQYFEKYKTDAELPIYNWMSNACKYFAYDAMLARKMKDVIYFTVKAHYLKKDNGALKTLLVLVKGTLLNYPVIRKIWTAIKKQYRY